MTSQATLESPAPAPQPPRRRRGGLKLLAVLTGVAVGLAVTVLAVWLPNRPSSHPTPSTKQAVSPVWGRPVVSTDGLVERSGVRVTRLAVTGDGGLVDLRYQIVDPNKADSLHDPATPPAVVDEASGLVVHELFMDHSHKGGYKAGVTYYFVFNNPGNWIHRGSSVTVLLGNSQVEHVVVK